MDNKLQEYKSLCAQLLHKEGITNFSIKIEAPSEPIHQCQLLITDNETQCQLQLIIVDGEKDIFNLMPMVTKKIKELRMGESGREQI